MTATSPLTVEMFSRVFPHCKMPEVWVPTLLKAWKRFGILDPFAQASFLGVTGNETGGFTSVGRENMNYTPERAMELFTRARQYPEECADRCSKGAQAFANWIYANRGGNGDEASGDGWNYRGGGIIQITFRPTYEAGGNYIGIDLLRQPDLIINPEPSAMMACWFITEYKPWILPLFKGDEDAFMKGGAHVGWTDQPATYRRLRYRRAVLEEFLGKRTTSRPLLTYGMKGPHVEILQRALNAWGAVLRIDTSFGPVTERAVLEFQEAHGLLADGKVGPATWNALAPFIEEN